MGVQLHQKSSQERTFLCSGKDNWTKSWAQPIADISLFQISEVYETGADIEATVKLLIFHCLLRYAILRSLCMMYIGSRKVN